MIMAILHPIWNHQVAAKGTLGANLDVTPTNSDEMKLFEMMVQSPSALADATLKIYKDSVSAGNLLFDGYLKNLNSDNNIIFPNGRLCTTKIIVLVSGSTDDVFALGKFGG